MNPASIIFTLGIIVAVWLFVSANRRPSHKSDHRELGNEPEEIKSLFRKIESIRTKSDQLIQMSQLEPLFSQVLIQNTSFDFEIPLYRKFGPIDFLTVENKSTETTLFRASKSDELDSLEDDPPEWRFEWQVKEFVPGEWSNKLDEFSEFVGWLAEINEYWLSNWDEIPEYLHQPEFMVRIDEGVGIFHASGVWPQPNGWFRSK
jgi:hypothetical protein